MPDVESLCLFWSFHPGGAGFLSTLIVVDILQDGYPRGCGRCSPHQHHCCKGSWSASQSGQLAVLPAVSRTVDNFNVLLLDTLAGIVVQSNAIPTALPLQSLQHYLFNFYYWGCSAGDVVLNCIILKVVYNILFSHPIHIHSPSASESLLLMILRGFRALFGS